jgi:fructose-bisphosphate aldolase class II
MGIMGGLRILGWSMIGESIKSWKTFTSIAKCPLTSHRLTSIREACKGKAQMVLHGTNTFPDETTQKCIKGGMTRINVNDLVLSKYNEYVKENTGKVPLTELMGKGTDLIQELCEYQMDVMGSSGKGEVRY